MIPRCNSILWILVIFHLWVPSAFAENEKSHDSNVDGEPVWAKTIPKGRYPCLNDAVPPVEEPPKPQIHAKIHTEKEKWSPDLPSTDEAQWMKDTLTAKLRQTTTGIDYPPDLCSEVLFRTTKENQLIGLVRQALTNDKAFNAAVFQAIYLSCNHDSQQRIDLNEKQFEYHFFFTPKGVFMSDSFPEKAAQRHVSGLLRIHEGRKFSQEEVQKIMNAPPPKKECPNDLQKFLNGETTRFDGYDAVSY